MYIAPDLAQTAINFLNRVPTTGLDEANALLAVAEGLKVAGENGAKMQQEAAEKSEDVAESAE